MRAHRILIPTLAATIAMAASIFAQVSPQAPPKTDTLTTIEGKITKLEYSNPHVFLHVGVIDPATDKLTAWVIETGSPSELSAKGIKRTDLRVGVNVRAKGTLGSVGKNKLETPVNGLSFPE